MAGSVPGRAGAAVRLRDVSPRLAFQARQVSTEVKVELVERLVAAGMRAIEVSSFVNPKLVPGLADAEQVFARVKRRSGVSFECCVANLTGMRRAMDAGADAAWFLLAADDGFSRDNIGRSIDESLVELARMRDLAAGSGTRLGSYVIAAFGGPTGVSRRPESLRALLERLLQLDIGEWILADSHGYAGPSQVRTMFAFAQTLNDIGRLTLQVHDSRGLGLAVIAAGIDAGIVRIDTSLAGAGAHPAMPRARVGGVCTEDAVQMLDLMGIETQVDLPALIDAANWLDQVLGGQEHGFTRHVGRVPTSAGESKFAGVVQAFQWSNSSSGA